MSARFLASADDFLTRLLFDQTVFKETGGERSTGKMDHFAPRTRLNQGDLDAIGALVAELRGATVSVGDAWARFSRIKCTKTFMRKWDEDQPGFAHHARRYFAALRPDTGIAFRETDRYTRPVNRTYPTPSPTPPPGSPAFIDVAVFATRRFRVGDILELKGGIASLTEDEDDAMRRDGQRKDFSVIFTSRSQCFSLLLGPARFVNHDCRNNVEFYKSGNSMMFRVVEDIGPDEEIFTNYGASYFEDSNAACLCATCEKLQRGAFSTVAVALEKLDASSPPTTGHALTARRSIGPKIKTIKLATPPPSDKENRRSSDRFTVIIDPLRLGKRLVHPELPPPAGYKGDYRYDRKKQRSKYVGPLGTVKSPAPVLSYLGKRGRAESESESDSDSEEEEPKPKRPVTRRQGSPDAKLTLFKRTSLGGRFSSRISKTHDKITKALKGGEEEEEEEGPGAEGDEEEEESASEQEAELDFEEGEEGEDVKIEPRCPSSSDLLPEPVGVDHALPVPLALAAAGNGTTTVVEGGDAVEEGDALDERGDGEREGMGGSAGGSTGAEAGGGDGPGKEKEGAIVIASVDEELEEKPTIEAEEEEERDEEETEAASLMLFLSRASYGSSSSVTSQTSQAPISTAATSLDEPVAASPPKKRSASPVPDAASDAPSSSSRPMRTSRSRPIPVAVPESPPWSVVRAKRSRPSLATPVASSSTSTPRSTRSTQSIGPLRSFLESESVTSVCGGYNSSKGTYYSDRSKSFSSPIPAAPVPAATPASAPAAQREKQTSPPVVVTTRRTAPGRLPTGLPTRPTRSNHSIKLNIQSLVSSPEVLSCSGGYSVALGKYVGKG